MWLKTELPLSVACSSNRTHKFGSEEHDADNGNSVFNHMFECTNYKKYIKNLHCMGNKSFDTYKYEINSIQENTNTIDSAASWNTLLIKETLRIKLMKPV